jgi:hypothetical protein
MVGDPVALCLHLVEEDITVIVRVTGDEEEYTWPLDKCKLKVWPNDSTCLTITYRRNMGVVKHSSHTDIKFMSVMDQRRFCGLVAGVMEHKWHLPPVVRVRDEKYVPLSIWVGTFNQGSMEPPEQLAPWLPRSGYDVVVVGYQGCQEDEWIEHLRANMSDDMFPIAANHAAGIKTFVAVHKKHVHAVTYVEAEAEGTGIAHVGYNKGACSVSFCLYGTRLAFINCHLAAHHDQLERRISDIVEIVGNTEFGMHYADIDFTNRHNTFFFGDMNFRLEGEREEILEKVQEEDWEGLWELDQLKTCQESGLLHGFEEGPLKFPPTYKYKVIAKRQNMARKAKAHLRQMNVREYDDDVSVVSDARFTGVRKPAWTDRILFRPLPGTLIKNTRYNCEDSIMSSPHSPVYGTYMMSVLQPPHSSVQMRRGSVIITRLFLSDLLDDPGVSKFYAKVRFPFIDDMLDPDFRWHDKYVRKMKLTAVPGGGYEYKGRMELGPLLTRPQSLRNEFICFKFRHKKDRIGSCAVSLAKAVNTKHTQHFSEDITSDTYPQGRVVGDIEVRWESDLREGEDTRTLTTTTKAAMMEMGMSPEMIEQGVSGGAMTGGMMGGMMGGGGGMMMGGGGGAMDDGAGVGSLLDPTDRTALEMRMDGTLVTADGMEAGTVDSSVAMMAGHVMHDTTMNPMGDMAGDMGTGMGMMDGGGLDDLAMLEGLDVPAGGGGGGGAMMMQQQTMSDMDEIDELDLLDIPGSDAV